MKRFRHLLLAALCLPLVGQSQIVTDGTVGAMQNLTGPNFTIPETLGTRAGANLFHSFQDFNIANGETATFTGGAGINNVLSRVTGGNASTIDGTLRSTIPGANVYLMNPNGVIFGANSSIDVEGNFAVTTADSIGQAGGDSFAATPAAGEVLSMAAPESFGFLNANPSPISFNGSQIALRDDKNLTIAGGNFVAENGASLSSPGGEVQIASVASVGTLDMSSWDTSGFSTLASITVRNGTRVHANGPQAGTVRVRARDIAVSGGAMGRSSFRSEASAPTTGGNVDVSATGTLNLNGGSVIGRMTGTATGTGPSVTINAQQMTIQADGTIENSTFGNGNAGNITINAPTLTVDGTGGSLTGIFSQSGGTGDSGNMNITGNTVELRAGAIFDTSAFSAGDAGDISVNASRLSLNLSDVSAQSRSSSDSAAAGRITLTGSTQIDVLNGSTVDAHTRGLGRAGDITLQTGDLTIDRQGNGNATGLFAESRNFRSSAGRGGDISVTATDGITFRNATLQTDAGGTAGSGDVSLSAKDITLENSTVNARNRLFGSGNGGDVMVNATGDVTMDDGIIRTDADGVFTAVQSGNVSITARNLTLRNGASIDTRTVGPATAGNININVGDAFEIDGRGTTEITGLITDSQNGFFMDGLGGNIEVSADSLALRENSILRASTSSSGDAGDITVNVVGRMTIDAAGATAQSGLISQSAGTSASGDAGNISVTSGSLEINNAGQISSSSSSPGDSGMITVNVSGDLDIDGRGSAFFTGLDANSTSGNTGNLTVSAQNLTIRDNGVINNTVNGTGRAGEITVTVSDSVDIDGASRPVPFTGLFSGRLQAGTAAGESGTINVTGGNLFVRNGGRIETASRSGNAGDINLVASRSIDINNNGNITVQSLAASAGTINLRPTHDLNVSNSEINARAQTDGGNIFGQARFITLSASQLTADAVAGNGGRITLNSLFSSAINGTTITADSQAGQAGTVDVRNQVDIASSLVLLPEGFLIRASDVELGCRRDRPSANSLDVGEIGAGSFFPVSKQENE